MFRNKIVPSSSIFGSMLVAIGALYLFDGIGMLDFNFREYLFSLPMLFTVWGIFRINSDRQSIFGYVLLFGGLIFLAGRMFPFLPISSALIIPTIFIVVGFVLIFSPIGKQMHQHFNREFRQNNCRL